MPRKIVIIVAPVAHMEKEIPQGIHNPVEPEILADEVIKCVKAGASVAHLHIRDEHGKIVGNLDTFSHTIDLIRAKTDVIIQGSSGGVSDLSLDDRCVAVNEKRLSSCSLNMGTTNWDEGIFVNSFSDIRYWAKKMDKHNVVPELEIFNDAMVETCLMMKEEGVLHEPLRYNFSLGHRGALAATPENLIALRNKLPAGSKWTFIHEGMPDFSLLATAIALGATGIRVGYEDSFYIGNGKMAKNHEIVEAVANMIRLMGYEIANVDEAMEILQMPKK